jgi:hypothetical protein
MDHYQARRRAVVRQPRRQLQRADHRTPEEWQQWHRTTRKAITRQLIVARGQGMPKVTRLIHA